MTGFAFTPPLAHLKDFEPHQDFTFGLSFLLERPEYRKWVQWRHNVSFTIMDNSFNETQIPATVEDVVALYKSRLCDVVIQPDADNWSSAEMFEAFRAVAAKIGIGSVMGIYRNSDERLNLFAAGARFTALSYWWRRDWPIDTSFRNTHFLGLGAMSPFRPWTMDTTIPIKMAMRGERMEEWDGTYKMPPPEQLRSENRLARAWKYFDSVLTDEQLELAVHNIGVLRGMFNGPVGD